MLKKEDIKKIIINATRKAIKGKKLPILNLSKEMDESLWQSVAIDHPENKEFGDWASNVAMKLAKLMKKSSIEIAEIVASVVQENNDFKKYFDKIKVERPGFINFYLSEKYLQKSISEILKQKNKFGDSKIGKNKKIQLEFISANPTGPLTLGNGRGGFMGDVLRNVMKSVGYKVDAEYFINDSKHSNQVRELGKTVLGKGEMYKSDFLVEMVGGLKKEKDIESMGYKTAQAILKNQKKTIANKFKITIDNWFSEQLLYDRNDIERVLGELGKLGLSYKKDGAIWLKTSERGDDEDRVLVRSDGEPTYFASDIAYHSDKFKRGYVKMINFWGADHHGHIKRLKIALEMLGYDSSKLDVITMQLVRLIRDGKEVKMSKRAGQYVTLEELIEEVGLDVVRFFFLMVSANRHMDFDLGLAKEKSEKNPVYYAQYAGARIHSILAKSQTNSPPASPCNTAGRAGKSQTSNFKPELLNNQVELDLIRKLAELPEVIEDMAKDYQVHRLPSYAIELARSFHNFYNNCRVISDDKHLTQSRIGLILATQIVLKKVLSLMGVSMPNKM